MPLFSAATFTDDRRNGSNVQTVTAIVVEHDAGERAHNPHPMQPAEAVERLRQHGISAVVYSTPSSTHECPRWRAVIRLEQAATREQHRSLVALVNALLGGVLAPAESNDPARAWYYGKVRGADYFAEVVDGNAIDVASLFDELPDPIPLTPNRPTASHEDDSLIEFVDRAQAIEHVNRQTIADIRSALAFIDPDDRGTWIRIGIALAELGDIGFDLWSEWSARSPKFEDGKDDPADRWATFRDSHTDYRTIFAEAQRNGWKNPRAGSASPRRRFDVQPARTFVDGKPSVWIIKGVLPQAELAIVFGESGSGKTFLVLDLIAHVARGIPYRDRRVNGGNVVYIAAEGVAGVRNRIVAYCRYAEIEPDALALGIIADAPNFLEDDHEPIAEAIARFGGASLVVVDTLAATTPGANENSGEDMGAVLGRLKQLHEATGALVVLVHHSGKDASRGARGWSGLRAAADVEIEVTRLGDSREATITKLKDGDDNARFGFRLVQIAIGVDDDGDPITSCIVEPVECSATPAAKPRKAGKWETAILAALGSVEPDAEGYVSVEAVLAAASERTPRDPQGRDRRREYLTRALESLAIEGAIFVQNDRIKSQ
ncbi:MAG TPA: AAA family ATPase [Zeimonas sp.]